MTAFSTKQFFTFLLHKNVVFSGRTRGIPLVQKPLLLASNTLYTQCRDIEHLHEDFLYQGNNSLTKLQHFEISSLFQLSSSVIRILCLNSDSAYLYQSSCC